LLSHKGQKLLCHRIFRPHLH